jgi:hypothetical protein
MASYGDSFTLLYVYGEKCTVHYHLLPFQPVLTALPDMQTVFRLWTSSPPESDFQPCVTLCQFLKVFPHDSYLVLIGA